MGTHHDDRSVDRLLEAALRARPLDAAPAGPSCVDAETIAAWSDGTLSASEALAVEAHLSSCPRCLETAAVFARSAPPALTAPAVAWWQRVHIRWLAPALAGAMALTLFVLTRGPGDAVDPAGAPAQQEQARASGNAAPGAARAVEPARPQAGQRTDSAAAEKAAQLEVTAPPPAQRAREARGGAGRAANEIGQQARRDLADSTRAGIATPTGPPVGAPIPSTPGVALATPPAPPTVTAAAPPPPSTPRPEPQPPPVTAPTTKPEPAPAAIMAFSGNPGFVVADFRAPVGPAAIGRVAQTQGAGGRGGGRGAGRGGGGVAREEAAAPPARVRWRVMSSGLVRKSLDGGRTWTYAAVDPALQVTGGIAPAPDVCWLIGRAGVVLLTTDGSTFTRVSPAIQADIVQIQATSALEATITTASGLSLTTTDGGKTWR